MTNCSIKQFIKSKHRINSYKKISNSIKGEKARPQSNLLPVWAPIIIFPSNHQMSWTSCKNSHWNAYSLWWSSWPWGSRWWAKGWPEWGSWGGGQKSKGNVSANHICPLCTHEISRWSGHCSYEWTVLGSSAKKKRKIKGIYQMACMSREYLFDQFQKFKYVK